MKIFGSISELLNLVFRKNSQAITLRPNQATTYTAARDVQFPPGDTAQELVSTTATQTLTNKTITSPLGLVKSDVGLGNVDNTSDATKDAAAAVLTNKKLDDITTEIVETSDNTVALKFNVTGTASTKTTLTTGQTADRVIVFPDASGNVGLVTAAGPVRSSGTAFTTGATALGSEVSGTLPIANGGTGQTTATLARTALLPTQSGNSGRFLQSDGTDTSWASASGGAGEINAVLNPSAADVITGWDVSGAGTPVVARVATGGPLSPIVPSMVRCSGGSAASYIYYNFTLPTSLLSKKLKIEWHQAAPTSGEWKVEMRTQAGVEYSLSTDATGDSLIPAAAGKYSTTFDADTTTTLQLRFVRVTGSGNLDISNVIVGPGIQPQGAVVSGWRQALQASEQPSLTNISNTFANAYYRRTGDSIEMIAQFSVTGVATGNITLNTPSAFSVDFTKVNTGAIHGQVRGRDDSGTSTTIEYHGFVQNTGGSAFYFRAPSGQDLWSAASPFTWANTDSIYVRIYYPVSQWAGSGNVNLAQNDVEYAYNTSTATTGNDTTSFGYGPAGIGFYSLTGAGTRRVRFQTAIQATDSFVLEYQPGGSGNPWLEINNIDGGADLGPYQVQNTGSYGFGLARVSGSTTDIDVVFGTYAWPSGATYGAAGVAWSGVLASSRWRVRKVSGGNAVGFGAATATSSGLLPATSTLGLLRLGTQNGYGSSSTTIRRFSTTISNTSDVTYSDSATLGGTITINTGGIYSLSYTDSCSAGCNMGISLNSSQLTTNIAAITQADRLVLMAPTGNDSFLTCSVTLYLASGSVIRAHGDATGAASSPTRTQFTLQRLA